MEATARDPSSRSQRMRKRTRCNRRSRAARFSSDSLASPIALLPTELVDAILYWLDGFSLARCLRASPLFWRTASRHSHLRARCEMGGRKLVWRGRELTEARYFVRHDWRVFSWQPCELTHLGVWCDLDTAARVLTITPSDTCRLAFLRGAIANPDAAVTFYALWSATCSAPLDRLALDASNESDMPQLVQVVAALASSSRNDLASGFLKRYCRGLCRSHVAFISLNGLAAGTYEQIVYADLFAALPKLVGDVYHTALGVSATPISTVQAIAADDPKSLWLVLLAACIGDRADMARNVWDAQSYIMTASRPAFGESNAKHKPHQYVKDASRCYAAHGDDSPHALLFRALPSWTMVSALVLYASANDSVPYGKCAVEAIAWAARRGQQDTLWWLAEITGLTDHRRARKAICMAVGAFGYHDILASFVSRRWTLTCTALVRGLAEATRVGRMDTTERLASTYRAVHPVIPHASPTVSHQPHAAEWPGRMLPGCACCKEKLSYLYKAATQSVSAAAFWLTPGDGGFNASDRDSLLCEALRCGRLKVARLCISADITPSVNLDQIAARLQVHGAWRLGARRLNHRVMAEFEGVCAVAFSRLAQAKACLLEASFTPRFIYQLLQFAWNNPNRYSSECLRWVNEMHRVCAPSSG